MKSLDEILKKDKGYELCYHLSGSLSNKIRESGFDSLTPEEKTFFIVHEMDCQVQNGGFHSYFANYTGEHANEILAALSEVKAMDEADLMKQAISIFPNSHVPTNNEERYKILCKLTEDIQWKFLNDLSAKYYDLVYGLPFEEGLDELLATYIRANKSAFK